MIRALVPTRRLVWAAVPAVALGLVLVLLPALRPALYAFDGLLVLVAWVDAARILPLVVDVRREAPRVWSSGRGERVLVRLRAEVDVVGVLHASLPPELQVEGLPAPVHIPAGGETTVAWRGVLLRRGRYTLGAHHLRTRSPWGLWERQVDLDAADDVEVWPDVKQLAEYDLLARRSREGLLLRSTRRAGNDAEFDRLRPWRQGDDLRHVDWKATARAQAPIVRQMREPTGQTVQFLLDCGRTMTAETDGRPAFDHALDALLLLAHIALRKGDRVGLLGVDAHLRAQVAPAPGSRASRALLRAGCELHPSLEEPDWERAIVHLAANLRRRALVVVFSNLVDEVGAARLATLFRSTRRHLVVWVCLRDPGLEALADDADRWARGAAAEVMAWRRGVLDRVAMAGVHVLDVSPHELTPALVDRYLALKQRG